MSMTSELVQELRRLAKSHCFYGSGCTLEMAAKTIEELSEKLAAENMERSSAYYNGGWIPVSERMPEKPTKNPEFDNKPLELYLVSAKNTKYPIYKIPIIALKIFPPRYSEISPNSSSILRS